MKLGLAQLLVEGGEPERNLERAEKLIVEAVNAQCDVILLPEVLDFAWTHPSSLKEAESIPGKYSQFFSDLARKHAIWLCLGLTEKVDDNKRYNTAILINDTGEIVLKYHKINLLEVEFPFYEVGQTLNVVDTPWGKIGVNICADNYLGAVDIGHVLARMGAQIILSPSSWTVDYSITEEDDPYQEKWLKPLRILADTHDLVVANCTSVGYIVGGPYEGKKMVGCSLVVGKHHIIAQGQFNEFAGELTVVEFEVPSSNQKGVQIKV